MNSPHESELSHPLEEVTGEKDVHPEEEQRQSQTRSGPSGTDDGTGPGPEDTAAGQERP